MPQEHVPVLIVGGGIVGLSASLFLSRQGVSSLLVERHQGTSIHPRARGVNTRTMETYRELGLEEAIRVAGAELSPSFGLFTARTLREAIEPLPRRSRPAVFAGATVFDEISPTSGNRVTQDLLEPVLLAEARKRGGDLHFSTELRSFEQDEAGVTATIVERESGLQSTVRADYMLAADGAGSHIREMLGVSLSGKGTLGYLLNILFRADLRAFVQNREFSICVIEQPELRGLFTSINNSDRWVFHLSYDPAKGEKPADFPPERCQGLLHQALGMPDLELEIKSILPWEAAVRVVDGFQQGRVFFAGDAAHQMPPWGGQGANTGVQDVHNLAWKLAAVLKGQAAPALLTTYDVERRPVGRKAAEKSAQRADKHGLLAVKAWQIWLMQAFLKLSRLGLLRKAMSKNAQMASPWSIGYGYQYHSSAIIPDSPKQQKAIMDGHPGTRVPHIWVEHQGRRISTLDLLGVGFVLFAGSSASAWSEAATSVASRLGVELTVYQPGPKGNLLDKKNLWPARAGISPSGALLVRPDGFVAWRSREQPHGDPAQEIEQVLTQVLSREALQPLEARNVV